MLCTDARTHEALEAARPVALESLDTTTLRALCDGGWLDHATYLGIARARGITVPELPAMLDTPPTARAYVVVISDDTLLSDVTQGLKILGGYIAAVFDRPSVGAVTFPEVDTRMQHQRPRQTPTISIA